MTYTIITAKDDTVVILSNQDADWRDFVDCDTQSVRETDYLAEPEEFID